MVRPVVLVQRLHDLGIAKTHHDHVGVLHDVPGAVAHQRGNVRNRLLEIGPVGADQARDVDLRVVNLQFHALADELLGQRQKRALAQVVGAALKAQANSGRSTSRLRAT